jgi:prepilin-type N-terminal cleavage/methylation domain-containing protein
MDRSARTRAASSKGFSLLELTMVMVIILVTAAFSIPMVTGSLNAYRLNSAVASVTGAIQSTRYQAIQMGYPFQVVFDNAAGTYQIKSDVNDVNNFVNVGSAIPFSQANWMGAATTFTFRPGGAVQSPQAAANGTTTMTVTYKGKVETITVSAYGLIQVTP